MTRVKINLESLDLFDRLIKRGYIIDDGYRTRRLSRLLKNADLNVYNAWARDTKRDTKKVILAIENSLKATPVMRTRKSMIFDIKGEK